MLTREDVVEIVALHRRGWSGSAIVRHTGPARKAVRAWLAGERDRESRRRPSPLEPFRAIVQRFGDDPLDHAISCAAARSATTGLREQLGKQSAEHSTNGGRSRASSASVIFLGTVSRHDTLYSSMPIQKIGQSLADRLGRGERASIRTWR